MSLSRFWMYLRPGSRRGAADLLLAAVLLAAGCGGGKGSDADPQPAVPATTRTVPHYDAAREVLTLPQLRIGDRLHADVSLRLGKDARWTVLSTGDVRPIGPADRPTALLVGTGGLAGPSTDARLTIHRLHSGPRVFGSVAIQLNGNEWAFASGFQEVKTLQGRDFASHPDLRADESHHVVWQSDPAAAAQDVPMRLAGRRYEFCMDAQVGGADSATLRDAKGKDIFTLKAGEPCITFTAQPGNYTWQHRYGGNGSARTMFMRHQANTVAPVDAAQLTTRSQANRAFKASTVNFSGAEYWSVRSGYMPPDTIDFVGVVGSSSTSHPSLGASLCAGRFSFGYTNLWLSNTFLAVTKDVFGAPQTLGVPLACTSDPVGQRMGIVTTIVWNDRLATAFEVPGRQIDWGSAPLVTTGVGGSPISGSDIKFPDYLYDSSAWERQTLNVSDSTGRNFTLFTPDGFLTALAWVDIYQYPSSSPLFVDLSSSTDLTYPFTVDSRYFPGGLPSTVTLDVGQVALFTGPNCSGAAVVTSDRTLFPYLDMPVADVYTDLGGAPALYEPTLLPDLAKLGTSIQLGLQTTVTTYAQSNYQGEARKLEQLTCLSGIGTNGKPPGSIQAQVDTITMVISTNSCEYCNLAGVDFSGQDLTNVKLRNANLSGAVLANVDLSGADMRFTTLQGASLVNSNLDGANMCSAQLNGSATIRQAATLTGAHLRNTNLALANLDGARLSSASFYSGGAQGACQQTSCDSYVAPSCASAYGASVNNTSFDSAYLSNVDMGNVKGVGVDFSSAALFGVSFVGADFSHNNTSAVSSSFNKAYLHGVDFTRAVLTFAEFVGAQIDLDSTCVQTNLNQAYGQFPGSRVPVSPGSSSCIAGKPAAPFCVQTLFAASPAYPPTDCTNLCADGSRGGPLGPQNGSCTSTSSCSAASWASTLGGTSNPAMPTSSCSVAPLCGSAFSSVKNQCW